MWVTVVTQIPIFLAIDGIKQLYEVLPKHMKGRVRPNLRRDNVEIAEAVPQELVNVLLFRVTGIEGRESS